MGSNLIDRQAAIDAVENLVSSMSVCINVDEYNGMRDMKYRALKAISALPSAQSEPISEEYAKAVECWLMTYQIKCAELRGRYTPYEILGWIVSDWRKENEIWRFNRQTGGD